MSQIALGDGKLVFLEETDTISSVLRSIVEMGC